jgi:hypothetical protein
MMAAIGASDSFQILGKSRWRGFCIPPRDGGSTRRRWRQEKGGARRGTGWLATGMTAANGRGE